MRISQSKPKILRSNEMRGVSVYGQKPPASRVPFAPTSADAQWCAFFLLMRPPS